MSYKFVSANDNVLGQYFKPVMGQDMFFTVAVVGAGHLSKTFVKKSYPVKKNISKYSAITAAREYASAIKEKYPSKRVFILSSMHEVR